MTAATKKPKIPAPGNVPDLLGLLDVAVLFGKSHATADTWRTRARHGRALAAPGEDTSRLFPEPDIVIGEVSSSPTARTPAWRRDRLEAWGRLTGKEMFPDKLDALREKRRAETADSAADERKKAELAREKRNEYKRNARQKARSAASE